MTDDFIKKLDDQSKDFHTWIGVQGEDSQHKLDLVVEGFKMLAEKIDSTSKRAAMGQLVKVAWPLYPGAELADRSVYERAPCKI